MIAAPVLGVASMDATLAWRGGQARSGRQLLADAHAQAQRIPGHAQAVVNLCGDRYEFTVMLVAAMLRGLPSWMPPNALPATLERMSGSAHTRWLVDAMDPQVTVASTTTPNEVPVVKPDFDAAVLLTSGSTGAPVPHPRSWGSMVLNARAQAERMASLMGRRDLQGVTIVATVPPQHSYGFESSVMLALLGGAAFEASRPFYPADIVDALHRVPRPRILVTTPFHLRTFLASGIDALPPVDAIVSATAPLSPQLAAHAERALGGPLFEVYGCTEAGQVATRHTTASPTWTTYGELRVHRRGPTTSPTYPPPSAGVTTGDAESDAESYWVQGGHVFRPTPLADILEIDDAQHFRLLGRQGDLIHVAGKRSSLAHLNHELNSIPGVEDGAFYMPEEVESGHIVRPVVFVVAPALTTQDVARALQQRVDAVFVPRRIVSLDALPHEATGKITAGTLRALAQQHGVA